MCGRYTIVSKATAVELEMQAEFQYSFEPIYNAHRGAQLPVVLSGQESQIVPCQWGLVPSWSSTCASGKVHLSATAKTIVKHPAFRVPVRTRRCLVLANCFFIWVPQHGGTKVPLVVYDSRQRIFSMAGVWDEWISPDKSVALRSFAIVTVSANIRLSRFTKQMPVIIPASRRRKYLNPGIPLSETMRMLRTFESDSLNLYPVSSKVNHPGMNDKMILQPVGERVYKEFTYVPKVYLKLEGMGDMKDNPDRKPEIKLML